MFFHPGDSPKQSPELRHCPTAGRSERVDDVSTMRMMLGVPGRMEGEVLLVSPTSLGGMVGWEVLHP